MLLLFLYACRQPQALRAQHVNSCFGSCVPSSRLINLLNCPCSLLRVPAAGPASTVQPDTGSGADAGC